MAKKRIRLSIKLSSFTALMVVLSMLVSFYLTRGARIVGDGISAWVLIFSGVTFVIGLLYTLFLDRIITVPVQNLMSYTTNMVARDYMEPVAVASGDELGSLAAAIDELRRSFLAQRRSLQELNERLDAKVEARTQELEQVLEHLRQTQEELIRVEKLASIGRLAGGIAHEINNPAAIILTRTGFLLETAKEDGLSEDTVESLQVIDRQVSRISRITHDLLVFSRQSPMNVGPVNLSDILNWSWTLYGQTARALEVRMVGDIPARVMVRGNAAGLEQVIGNLVKNALDAMEEQGGELIRGVSTIEGRVVLTLEDTGPGIDPAIMPRIFDPFFTTKAVGKGTGLGLAISYGILQELDGTLEAANRPAGGAVFTVTLPAAPNGATTGPLPLFAGEGSLT